MVSYEPLHKAMVILSAMPVDGRKSAVVSIITNITDGLDTPP